MQDVVGNLFSCAFSKKKTEHKKTPQKPKPNKKPHNTFILNQFVIVFVKTIHREDGNEVISLMNPFKDN